MTKTDITTSLVLGGQFTIDHNIVIRHYQAELRCYIMKLAWERHERFNLGAHCLQRLHRHEVPAKNVLEELFTVGLEVIDAREPSVRYAVTFVTDDIKDSAAMAQTGSSTTQVLGRRYPRQQHIADALGLTKVHISRTLQALRQEGLLEIGRDATTILDTKGLRELADYTKTEATGW